MPDSSSKSGSPRQPSSRPPFQEGLAGDPLFELECPIPARKADPQDNLHHGPLSGGTGRGSAFRAGMPDSSSKSGSPRQPSSRPPFRRDWPGIRFSRWNAFRAGMPDSSSKSGSLRQPSSRPPFHEGLAGDPLFELECRIPARKADPQDNLHHGPLFRRDWPGIRFSRMPGSSSKSGSPRQPSSRPPFRRDWPGIGFSSWNAPQDNLHHGPRFMRDWPGIRFSSWNAGFQLEKRIFKTTFITAPFSGGIGRGSAFRAGIRHSSPRQPSSRLSFQEGLAGDPLFELESGIHPQDNLHHGPLSGGTGRGSAFRAGNAGFQRKKRIPKTTFITAPFQPFRRDWPGIRFSSWNAGFQLEKQIPKTTFITAPFQEGLAGDPLFELGMPDSSSKSGSARQPSSRPPFRRDWPGIRFSSWNAGFQLEKRIPKTTFITAPFQEGLAGDPLFELECPDSSSKSGSPRQPSTRPPSRRDWPGIRFSSWNAGFQLEKQIPKTTFITAPFQEGLAGDPLFELGMPDSSSKSGSPRQPSSRPPFQEGLAGDPLRAGMPDSSSKSGSPRQPSSRPPFQEGLAGDPLFELECRIPARKADPQDNLHHGPLFRRDWPGIRFSSSARKADPQDNLHHGPLFRRDLAGIQASSSKSGSPRQPSSRPPFRRDRPGIRFSSRNAGFQLEKRIPKTTFITAPFSGGIGRGSAFRAGMPDSSSKSGSPRQPSSRPPFQEGLAGDPLFELSPRQPSSRPPFQEGLAGDPLFELECRIPARKADPQGNLHHGPLFRRDWPGIRFSSWNAGFQLEKRIPKTTFITAPFQEGSAFSAETVLCFSYIWLFFSALRGSHVFRAQRRASVFVCVCVCVSVLHHHGTAAASWHAVRGNQAAT